MPSMSYWVLGHGKDECCTSIVDQIPIHQCNTFYSLCNRNLTSVGKIYQKGTKRSNTRFSNGQPKNKPPNGQKEEWWHDDGPDTFQECHVGTNDTALCLLWLYILSPPSPNIQQRHTAGKGPRCCCWLNDHNPISNCCPADSSHFYHLVLAIRCSFAQHRLCSSVNFPPHVHVRVRLLLLFFIYWQRCCYSPFAESLSDEERIANKIRILWMARIGTSIHEIDNKGSIHLWTPPVQG